MEDLKELFGRAMFHSGMSHAELVKEIRERNNNIGRVTVYNWMKGDNPVNRGRLKATLEAVIEESKGART